MVERIRTLLETRQLTPTQFADAIGIARPIVSHILSGRNKPSLEVVQRILAAMPDLSMPWLLNGTGPMLANAAAAASLPSAVPQEETPQKERPGQAAKPVAAQKAAPAPTNQPSRSRQPPISSMPAMASIPIKGIVNGSGPKRFPATLPKFTPGPLVEPLQAPLPEPPPPAASLPATSTIGKEDAAPVGAHSAPLPKAEVAPAVIAADATATVLLAGTEKPIRRIVIFYRDGSFSDYRPE